jgi:hypothetical protein
MGPPREQECPEALESGFDALILEIREGSLLMKILFQTIAGLHEVGDQPVGLQGASIHHCEPRCRLLWHSRPAYAVFPRPDYLFFLYRHPTVTPSIAYRTDGVSPVDEANMSPITQNSSGRWSQYNVS